MPPAKAKPAARKRGVGTNGDKPADPLAQALAQEAGIATEARKFREGGEKLTPTLLDQLQPLLERPIPAAYIQNVPAVKGKPYPSTGIRSAQVQIDRLNAVCGLSWWGYRAEYAEDGRLCTVTVWIGESEGRALVKREARGGVEQGSGRGNIYKGSFTNAAKLAFARLGVGHEVYVGAADMDPDTDPDAAEQQEGQQALPVAETISAEASAKLRDAYDRSGVEVKDLKLQLGAMGVAGVKSVNQALAKLTPSQAAELYGWLSERTAK